MKWYFEYGLDFFCTIYILIFDVMFCVLNWEITTTPNQNEQAIQTYRNN